MFIKHSLFLLIYKYNSTNIKMFIEPSDFFKGQHFVYFCTPHQVKKTKKKSSKEKGSRESMSSRHELQKIINPYAFRTMR